VRVPDAAHEALRDLVRARLKRDQLRSRNRLSKFLLRQGRRVPQGVTPWGTRHLACVKQQNFEQAAQQATLVDYLHEVVHEAERIVRLERSVDTAVETLPQKMRAVIDALQSLRGIAKVSAVSIMAELGEVSRFENPRQLMGYSGIVSREHSSGERTGRGGISKAGSAHLRRHSTAVAESTIHRQRVSIPEVLNDHVFHCESPICTPLLSGRSIKPKISFPWNCYQFI